MTTLIYSPAASIIIDSAIEGIIDVSDDVSSGSIELRSNGQHGLSFVLQNPLRKYDGLFAPNDRVVVQLKRFRWVQVFAGYIDNVPYYTAFPQPIRMSASCTLKILRNWPWDEGSHKAVELLASARDRDSDDGGISEVVTKMLTEVAGWPGDSIHIGKVPDDWRHRFDTIYAELQEAWEQEQEELRRSTTPQGGSWTAPDGSTNITGPGWEYVTYEEHISVVLATIRELESSNNYTAPPNGATASGAYQFIRSTWANYGGYTDAYLAPPEVQDAKAVEYMRWLRSKWGNKTLVIPYGWYYPAVFNNPSLLDTVPGHHSNRLTIREYGMRWLDIYRRKWPEFFPGTPPTVGSVAGAITGTTPDNTAPGVPGPVGPTTGNRWPIPTGVTQLSHSQVGWGGYQNGRIPANALTYTPRTGQGHPLAVQSWNELCDEAERHGLNVRGSMYRPIEGQEAIDAGRGGSGVGAAPGTSNHGWGLAIDITTLVPGSGNPKYPGYDKRRMLETPEYRWLAANAHRFGWGHPAWAKPGGAQNTAKEEPWHWEFFSIYYWLDIGYIPSTSGGLPNPLDEIGLVPGASPGTMDQLFNVLSWWESNATGDIASDVLSGRRALMNDRPLLNQIKLLLQSTGRHYCAAPNGDFMAWFPDYWDQFNILGKMDVELIELKDFAVVWSDAPLITHQYVQGASIPGADGPLPAGIVDAVQMFETRGVVTIDMPGLLDAILAVDTDDYPWLKNSDAFLRRFGARIDSQVMPNIYGPEREFYFAIQEFTKAWAAQFSANIPLSFMPELWPGMILRIPDYKVQFYVMGVSHSWDVSGSQGFTTTATVMAPSATDGSGFFLFPKGGSSVQRTGGTPSTVPGGLGLRVR